MRHWLETNKEELSRFLQEAGQPAYRAGQIAGWLHGKRVGDVEAMRNLPAALRLAMTAGGRVRVMEETERRDSADGLTSKWLFALPDAESNPDAVVESVLIIEREHRRRTVCVSSMAGCPLDCAFCATGRMGFVRNLSAGEIIEQVYRIDAFSRGLGDGMGVNHIVFMGMGEPLLNLDAVLRAASTLADDNGLGLSGRHITISTAGIPDGLRRLASAGVNYRLALSLHATSQQQRERIMPAARRWPLDEVLAALEEFAASASRDVTFEYCLIAGSNASPGDAERLANIAKSVRASVNLIPLNPVEGFIGKPPSRRDVTRFRDMLETAGVRVSIRVEKGRDIAAACGQLKAERRGKRGQ